MFSKISSLVKFYIKSDTIYRLHAPSFFDLVQKVFENKDYYYNFNILEETYQRLINSNENIKAEPFSIHRNQANKTIGEFAKKALHQPSELFKLYKLIKWAKPNSILELGSCLGLSTICLRLAAHEAEIMSVEGNEQFVKIAEQNNRTFKKILFYNELFESRLNKISGQRFDFIIIDGDHQYEATIRLMSKLKFSMSDRCIILMDDIHWSADMYKAWEEIRKWKEFNCSLESLRWGILFNDKNLSPIHFNLVPRSYKIWQKFIL